MEYLWQVHYDYSWSGLLGIGLRLALVYLVISLAVRWLERQGTHQPWQDYTERFLKYALLLFEPVALLLLSCYFILIQPFYHGLMCALALFAGLKQLRNYWSGRILQFDPSLRVGTRLSHHEQSGLITYIGRLGIRLQTDKGLLFLNYEDLLQDGYILLTGEESGSFFRLKVKADPGAEQEITQHQLEELLLVIPYLNWQHQPQIETNTGEVEEWTVSLALHEERHLNDLIERLAEQDFLARITKI